MQSFMESTMLHAHPTYQVLDECHDLGRDKGHLAAASDKR